MTNVTVTDMDSGTTSDDDVNPAGLESTALDFAVAILSGEWCKGKSVEEMQEFRNNFADYFQAATTLRVKLDAQIWAGHDDGSISESVESVRARRVDNGNKPGRKAQPKSLAEQLLKR